MKKCATRLAPLFLRSPREITRSFSFTFDSSGFAEGSCAESRCKVEFLFSNHDLLQSPPEEPLLCRETDFTRNALLVGEWNAATDGLNRIEEKHTRRLGEPPCTGVGIDVPDGSTLSRSKVVKVHNAGLQES